jgi:hypothetical protein
VFGVGITILESPGLVLRLPKALRPLRTYLALYIHRTDFLSLDKSLFGTVAVKKIRPLQEVLRLGLKDGLR